MSLKGEPGGFFDSVTKCHMAEGGGQPKCNVTFFGNFKMKFHHMFMIKGKNGTSTGVVGYGTITPRGRGGLKFAKKCNV